MSRRTAPPPWYRRLADVPGIGYAGDPSLVARHPDRGVTPKVYGHEGHSPSLSWSRGEGFGGSSSPAREFGLQEHGTETTPELRARMLMAFELPGEAMDYHFILLDAGEALWKRRAEDPADLALAEWCWWLDVRLMEAHPEMMRISPDKDEFLSAPAFERIVNGLIREGHVDAALAAAERFAQFRPRVDLSELRARVARLRAEDG